MLRREASERAANATRRWTKRHRSEPPRPLAAPPSDDALLPPLGGDGAAAAPPLPRLLAKPPHAPRICALLPVERGCAAASSAAVEFVALLSSFKTELFDSLACSRFAAGLARALSRSLAPVRDLSLGTRGGITRGIEHRL